MSSKPFIRRVPVIVLMCFSLEVSRHNAAFPFPLPPSGNAAQSSNEISSFISLLDVTLEAETIFSQPSLLICLIRPHPTFLHHHQDHLHSSPPKTPCSVSQFGDPSPHARTQNFFGSLALSIQQRAYLGHWSPVASKPPALPYYYVLCPQPTDLSDSRCPFTLEHCVAHSRVYGVH
ncbi:hypothetical protein LY78DRAFT_409847 [Colletotrichum sublineola]|nr:hypothetical protein LY78DRAFT_409847 [Colletotrichum sublineola]